MLFDIAELRIVAITAFSFVCGLIARTQVDILEGNMKRTLQIASADVASKT